MKTFELTEEQIRMIVHALKTQQRVNRASVNEMFLVCGTNATTTETAKAIIEGCTKMQTLLNYLES